MFVEEKRVEALEERVDKLEKLSLSERVGKLEHATPIAVATALIMFIILLPAIVIGYFVWNLSTHANEKAPQNSTGQLHRDSGSGEFLYLIKLSGKQEISTPSPHQSLALWIARTRSSVALQEFPHLAGTGQDKDKKNKQTKEQSHAIKFACFPFFSFIEVTLVMSFFLLVIIAIHKYLETKNLWTTDSDFELSENHKIFNELAIRHKKLSQLWFTISMAIFCGGLIYALFHVMKTPCKEVWGFDTKNSDWVNDLVHFIPNLFLYSIFFVGYMWSLKNYKAHWHNFVTNEHRYASLVAINEIRKRNDDPEIKKQLDMQSAVVVLIPSETAYLEGEGKDEITAAERLLKIEEAIRELATQKEGKSK